jgi:large repetitive protein
MRVARIACLAFLVAAIEVAGASAFGFTDDTRTLPNATARSPYRAELRARNGCPPYSFHMSGDSLLPPGLSLAADGTISGTPPTTGSWSFWLGVHDSCGGDSQRPFSIAVFAPAPAAEVGVPLTVPLRTTGPPGTQSSWWLASGVLPAGVTLDPAGVLRGTPQVAGSFPLEVGVTDPQANGPLPPLQLTLAIAPLPRVVTARLPRGRVGARYGATLVSRAGTAPVTWRILRGRGTLPPGLRLDGRRGVLAGKPRQAGVYRFAVALTDRFGRRAMKLLAVTVTRSRAR